MQHVWNRKDKVTVPIFFSCLLFTFILSFEAPCSLTCNKPLDFAIYRKKIGKLLALKN